MPQGKHRHQMAAETPARLAFDDCGQEGPPIRQSEFVGSASCAQVQEGKAGRRPTVKLSSMLGSTGPLNPFEARDYMRNVTVSATLDPPIFTGGLIGSQVRQAEAEAAPVHVQLEVARRGAIKAVSPARAQRRATLANSVSEAAAVRAAQATFNGMRVESRTGLRITLDVLTAQETLRDVEIALAEARHYQYVTTAGLLQTVVRLEVQKLPLTRRCSTISIRSPDV